MIKITFECTKCGNKEIVEPTYSFNEIFSRFEIDISQRYGSTISCDYCEDNEVKK